MAKDKIVNKKLTKNEDDHKQAAAPSAEKKDNAIWQDERFQHLIKDPRFKNLPKTERKVKIDKRFQSMFTDDKFKVKYTVDKYGRHINKSNADDLRKYYELESGEDSVSGEELERHKEEKAISREAEFESADAASDSEVEPGENDELQSDGEKLPSSLKKRLCNTTIDYARGEGRLLTDSSSDDETSEEEEDEVANIDHVWGELHVNAETTEEATYRLAVCNMDWDRIRAVDLMVLLSSFLPPGGSILNIKIYPSEFGKQRMAEEEHHGPSELIGLGKKTLKQKSAKNEADSEEEEELIQAQDSDAEEGNDYHMEKLRQYQLNRLRYYYAVVECNSAATANKIYTECDGIEYESSATRVDLRFIPDDTTFDEDKPTDVCTELPETTTYKPRQFTTTALQQVKVDLTWDETAVERKELGDKLSSGKLDEVDDKDLRKIVAYSSEEEDDDEEEEAKQNKGNVENKSTAEGAKKKENTSKQQKKVKKNDEILNKYKALLAEINEKEKEEKNKKYEMEFTWEVNDDKAEKNDQEPDSNAAEESTQLTPIEKVLKKRSEKNKKRKDERKRRALLAKGIDPDDQNAAESDDDSIPDGIDMSDPYFAEEFANGNFIDTKNKNKESTKTKKKKTREEFEEQEREDEKEAQELSLLLDDDDENADKNHFSLAKILKSEQETKSKRKRRKLLKKSKSAIAEQRQQLDDNFEVNVNDERFKNLYTSHLYNIDPTDSHFRKTKGMEKLIQEKFQRREKSQLPKREDANDESTAAKRPKKQIENTLLVKSLKRKLQLQQQKQLQRN